jgi:hypothetical protein
MEWTMSDNLENNEGRDTEGLLDAQGRERVAAPSADFCAQMEDCIREQPLKSALILLVAGFVIGRFRLIV